MTTDTPIGIADLFPVDRRQQQKAWNWYDWANSAYFTTIGTVLFGPWMIAVAKDASTNCDGLAESCIEKVDLVGLDVAAGALPGFLVTFATLVGALVLPIVGAFVDRSARKKKHMAVYAWTGSAFAATLFFSNDGRWWVGAVAIVASNILVGCSLVCYNAILVDISTEEERDAASSRGWAFGYLGGGVLLALNLVVVLLHDTFGLSEGFAVRISMLSAAVWWAAFTFIPVIRLRNYAPMHVVQVEGTLVQRSFGQLWATLKEMRRYPQTLTFLLAYLFYNDGIQTVINNASTYGAEQLGLDQTVLIATILMVQFMAFGGALLFGRLAARIGSYKPLLWGTFGWMAIVVAAFFLPAENVLFFVALGVGIAIVMGGTQALSRSFFSLLIPRGREGEYFSLYQACERGTSWLGSLVFALMFQLFGSYRPSIIALIIFFVLGAFFLLRLDPERGIAEAGNRAPAAMDQ